MRLNYIIYKFDTETAGQANMMNINKVYTTGTASLKQIQNGILNEQYPELFSPGLYCQVIYFLPSIQPSLWDHARFY